MDDGPAAAMEQACAAGAAILAAHPHDSGRRRPSRSPRATSRGAGGSCAGSSIAWSSSTGGGCSAGSRRPDCRPVARGDLHRAEQLPGWTTLVPCEQDERALVDYLRSDRPVFLTRLEQPTVALAA
jgi:hypothetical protein